MEEGCKPTAEMRRGTGRAIWPMKVGRLIAIDTNILVYAHREDSPLHEAASQRMQELAEGSASWAIPWPCMHEFPSIVTHPRIYAPPTPLSGAPLASVAEDGRRRPDCRSAGP